MKPAAIESAHADLRTAHLVAERAEWLAFLRRRVATDADAEDLLQGAFLQALRRVGTVRADENLRAWFYRVLRHALADHHRRNAAQHRRGGRLHSDMKAAGEDRADFDAGDSLGLCGCLLPRLKALKPRYAELIWLVELEGQSPADVAKTKKLTLNALNVSLHRARQSLRRELEHFCGECARTACLHCDCPPVGGKEKV